MALLVLGCGRVDESTAAAPATGGHSSMPIPAATGGIASSQGGVATGGDGFGGSDSGGAAPGSGGSTTTGSAPDASYPIIEVPATCASYPADTCGYVSDGFGSIIYCGSCPCAVTCEEVCTSGSSNSVPRCVTDYDATSGYTLECARSTGCNDGHLRRCWCKRT